MARSRVLQAAIKGKLEQDFSTFQAREKLNDADAIRDLLTLALRIKLGDSNAVGPSNRELMEEIYRLSRRSSAVVDIIHGQTFDGETLFKYHSESKAYRQQVKADVDNKVDCYLSGKKKE